jgi:hypothetical protein
VLSLTSGGEFMVSAVIEEGALSGVHAGNEFVDDAVLGCCGYAHLPAASTAPGAHQAEWDSTADIYCADAAAFGP